MYIIRVWFLRTLISPYEAFKEFLFPTNYCFIRITSKICRKSDHFYWDLLKKFAPLAQSKHRKKKKRREKKNHFKIRTIQTKRKIPLGYQCSKSALKQNKYKQLAKCIRHCLHACIARKSRKSIRAYCCGCWCCC